MSWDDKELAVANNLDEVLHAAVKMLKRLRTDGLSIHHIAGPITADGYAKINGNLTVLLEWRARLQAKLGPKAFVFTSPVIFNEGLYIKLGTFEKEPVQREKEFVQFWDKLLEAGVIDEIHFVPGWERSAGAQREYQTAKKVGIKINYLIKDKL